MGEISLAVRSLLKSKLFAAVAIITLVIGIGTTTAVFTVFSAVVLRPLPFPEQDRLVDVEEWSATELCAYCGVGVSRPMFADLSSRLRSISALGAYAEEPFNVGGADAPERVSGAVVSGSFFSVLGVKPLLGRAIDPTDDRAGAPAVAVLSERLFLRRFGGDRSVIGQQIRLNGRPTHLVGVMPASAVLPEFAQLWTNMGQITSGTDRAARDLGVIGRLKPGATIAEADAEVKVLAGDIAREHPDTQRGWTGRVRSLRATLAGEESRVYGLMLGAVIVLWAIICANLAGLLLSRGLARRREIAVRLALGARRRTVVWHLFAESLVLSVAGGILGVIAASWTIELLLASLDTPIPAWLEPRMDWRVIAFTLLLSLLSAAAFGLFPAMRASRLNLHGDLKAGAVANVGGGRSALRGSLVVVQLSLSLVLLAVAGVLSMTISRMTTRPAGTDEHDVIQARIDLLGARTPEQTTAFITSLVARFEAIPEARSAAVTGTGFIAGFGGQDVGIRAEGVVDIPPGVSPRFFHAVSPRYFETVRMTILQGRSFTNADVRGANPVVIINRRQAESLWPGRTAVGRRIRLGAADSLPWLTVVGVVNDIGDSTGRRSRNFAYLPFAQSPQRTVTMLVGARGEPSTLIKPMREIARAADADLPLLDLMTVDQAHARQNWPYRAYALTMTAFGTIALVLAAIGLYGIVSYAAEQRTREIGVRIALGARRSDVLQLVTRQGLKLVTLGVVLGIGGATLVMPIIEGFLVDASSFNAAVFAAATMLLVLVALFASFLPARRATRVDPTIALRSE